VQADEEKALSLRRGKYLSTAIGKYIESRNEERKWTHAG